MEDHMIVRVEIVRERALEFARECRARKIKARVHLRTIRASGASLRVWAVTWPREFARAAAVQP